MTTPAAPTGADDDARLDADVDTDRGTEAEIEADAELEADAEIGLELDDTDLEEDLALELDADGPEADLSFADLGVADDLVAALASVGITAPFAIQALTIPDALAGRDICGKAKTGSGKTLAFGIPCVERIERAKRRRPLALVLVPTRELAVQVTREFQPLVDARGLTVTAIYGGVSMDVQIKALTDGLDICVGTPGRIIDLIERGEMSVGDVRVVVIDEADQMADMGFLPQVERILRQTDSREQSMLFSATLDGVVGVLIQKYLSDPANHEVVSTTVTVDTMQHRFIQVHPLDKIKVCAEVLRHTGRSLVFTNTKWGADKLVSDLKREGIDAAAIHGGLHQQKRERTLKSFSDGKLAALVATDVAARGIHVDNVDCVIHFDPPEDPKNYLHRSGRTARAGEAGLVVTLVTWTEMVTVKRLQRTIGVHQKVVEMLSSDERLADLSAWEPPTEEAPNAGPRRRGTTSRVRRRTGGGPRRR